MELEPIYNKLTQLGYDRNYITIDNKITHNKDVSKLMDELFPPNKPYDIPNDIDDISYNQIGGETKNNDDESLSQIEPNDIEFNDVDCNVINYGKFKSTINPNVVNDKTKLTKEVYKSIKSTVDDVNKTILSMNKSNDSTKSNSVKPKQPKSSDSTKTNSKQSNSVKSNDSVNSKQKYYDYVTSCQKIKKILSDPSTLSGGISAESILDNLKDD